MPVSEKELARFLWEQPRACYARGLTIWHITKGRRYRWLELAPYGVAQQVSVCFAPHLACYFVQLVASTTGTLTAAHYQQAQAQLAALRVLLLGADRHAAVHTICVLVGRRVQPDGELVTALAGTHSGCQVFTYRYEVDGLYFEPARLAPYLLPVERAALDWLAAELLAERADAWALTYPPELAELQVTAGGILMKGGSHE